MSAFIVLEGPIGTHFGKKFQILLVRHRVKWNATEHDRLISYFMFQSETCIFWNIHCENCALQHTTWSPQEIRTAFCPKGNQNSGYICVVRE